VSGPGELTLTSIVLFTLGAYGVAAGAASGEQSVVAVGVFAFTLFVVGIVAPIVSLSRIRVDAWTSPDATVGERHDVHVRLHGNAGRVQVRVVDPPGEWWCTASPAEGIVPRVAGRRGVFHSIRVELRTSAPLGVFQRCRFVRISLPVPVTVAPRPTLAGPRLRSRPDDDALSTAPSAAPGAGDTARAVRPYVPGDPARLVHWPSTEDAEAAASRAAGIGRSTLAAGGGVWCCTHEVDGPVSAAVTDARDLGRRLARAQPGAPGLPPEGWPIEVVRA